MKITQISPDAWQLTRLGLVNCYLVREHTGNLGSDPDAGTFTLIDTGLPGSAAAILAAAASLGSPIARVLLTHAHSDHVGSVDALAAQLPRVILAASERSLPLLQRPADMTLRPGEPQDRFSGGLPGIRTLVTHLVADGELFGSLRAISTPGHIPGHLSFLDERDGTLYAGDELGVRRPARGLRMDPMVLPAAELRDVVQAPGPQERAEPSRVPDSALCVRAWTGTQRRHHSARRGDRRSLLVC